MEFSKMTTFDFAKEMGVAYAHEACIESGEFVLDGCADCEHGFIFKVVTRRQGKSLDDHLAEWEKKGDAESFWHNTFGGNHRYAFIFSELDFTEYLNDEHKKRYAHDRSKERGVRLYDEWKKTLEGRDADDVENWEGDLHDACNYRSF